MQQINRNRAITAERERQALALRRRGKLYAEIGQTLGITESGAWRLVKRAYKRSLKINEAEAGIQRELDLDRCDVAIDALWAAVLAGKTRAIEVLMAVLKRRADLLGLDAPAKIDLEQRIRIIATEAGLDPDEAVREAQRIVNAGAR